MIFGTEITITLSSTSIFQKNVPENPNSDLEMRSIRRFMSMALGFVVVPPIDNGVASQLGWKQ